MYYATTDVYFSVQIKIITNPRVYTQTGIRMWGLFHNILEHEFDQAVGLLSQATHEWGADCELNDLTCGRLFYLRGRGCGSLTVTQHVWGPFRA